MAHLLIKFGGGLITDKSAMKTVDTDVITNLANLTHQLISQGHALTIVHGAGSFGHLKAKEWRIAQGADEAILTEQILAVDSIREDMLKLDSILCDALEQQNIEVRNLPPSQWARETGPNFTGSLTPITNCPKDIVAVTFGDVVDCDPPKRFGILSGDDLMVRIAQESESITHCIFLLGDTEGLLSAPPSDPLAELIPLWKPSHEIYGDYDTTQDVTGGIFLKLESAAMIAQSVEHVWFLDGRETDRVMQLLDEGATRGTRIML